MIRIVTGHKMGSNGKIVLESKRATPKVKAEHILAAIIGGGTECLDLASEDQDLTPNERELVHDQILKLERRLLRLLGWQAKYSLPSERGERIYE